MNREWDVVIVGARVSGAATAMLLARCGLRVLCVERSRYGSDTISTHALMRGGVLLLQQWGVLDDVLAADTPPVQRTVFHYGAEPVAISIKPSAGVDALIAPRRTVLDTVLVDHARDAGAVFDFGARVVGVHRDASGAVAGVRVRDPRERDVRIERAALVIAADGRGSGVARDVAATVSTAAYHASSFLYGYWAGLPTDGYEWFYRPGVTAGAIPTNDGLTAVFVAGSPAVLDADVRAEGSARAFERRATDVGLGDRLAGAERVGALRFVHSLPPGYLRRAYGPGWALVGDAGHWLDPMSTHGMTSALRDAALLAEAIVPTVPGTTERDAALAHYQDVRDRLSVPMLEITDEIAGYGWDLARVRVLLRNLSSAMTDEVEVLEALAPRAGRAGR
jgi:2-polyprenyl-6-methoxyphenol hydroxylase-like FAD-dependent oxidoreductase